MPSKSEKQQKLFKLVHAYQTGKIPADKVSSKIKQIAKHISSKDSKKYATSVQKENLTDIFLNPSYIEDGLREIVSSKNANIVKGQLIDVFTANLLLTVSKKLTNENKRELYKKSINEMVAIAYKILTY